MSDVGACRSCKAPVIWTITPAGERRAPIDHDPDPEKGNTLILRQSRLGLLSIVLSGNALEMARRAGVSLRMNHWATCPDRAQWRRKTDEKKETAGASSD